MIFLGTILIVLATIGVGLLVDRKWDVIPRRERLIDRGPKLALPAHPPGAAPSTTIEASPGEVEKLRRKRCDVCRGETDTLADDRVTFDNAELLVISTRCRRCGRKRTTYIRMSE